MTNLKRKIRQTATTGQKNSKQVNIGFLLDVIMFFLINAFICIGLQVVFFLGSGPFTGLV
jgi:hypothetical protein